MGRRAAKRDTVRVHYTGRLRDGTVFDSSRASRLSRDSRRATLAQGQTGEPLEFVLGAGQVIPGLEQAIIGMHVNERKMVEILPDQAYGKYIPEFVKVVPRSQLNLGIDLQEGMVLELKTGSGPAIQITVTEITDTTVTLDANHPLAGETLFFELELMGISQDDE